jgi:hypothetical protein
MRNRGGCLCVFCGKTIYISSYFVRIDLSIARNYEFDFRVLSELVSALNHQMNKEYATCLSLEMQDAKIDEVKRRFKG